MALFDAVLFDCDGVLVDSEVVGLEDSVEVLRQKGFDWTTRDVIRNLTGMRTDRFSAAMRAGYDEVLGRPSTDEESETLLEEFIEARRAQRHTMREVDGALDTVKVVRDVTHLPMAVASSSAQKFLIDKIERFGFAPYFGKHVYSADFVDHGKPAPDIFLYAAEQLGADSSRCLVIEDSPHGVTAGVAAGATVWGFTGGGHCLEDHGQRLVEAGAERIIATHKELQQQFRHLEDSFSQS